MAPIIPAKCGENTSLNRPVAANQTILKGDLVTLTAGVVSKAAVGAANVYGIATHDITTGAVVVAARDRLIVARVIPDSKFIGQAKNGQAVTDALIGTTVGFIVEGGEVRLDPAAVVKQAVVTGFGETGPAAGVVQNRIEFKFLAANRQPLI